MLHSIARLKRVMQVISSCAAGPSVPNFTQPSTVATCTPQRLSATLLLHPSGEFHLFNQNCNEPGSIAYNVWHT